MHKQNIKRHIHSTRVAVLLLLTAMLMASALQDTSTCISKRCSVDGSASDSGCHCNMGGHGGNACAMLSVEHASLKPGCNCVNIQFGMGEAIIESGFKTFQRDLPVKNRTVPAVIRSHQLHAQEWTRLVRYPANRYGPALSHIRAVVLLI